MPHASSLKPQASSSPLGAVMAFVFLNSLGTGAAMGGVFFIAKSAHHFDSSQNYRLALVMSATYIVGALGVGPILRRLVERYDRCTTRRVLGVLMVVLAGLCSLPWLAMLVAQAGGGGGGGGWAIWVFAGVYGPVTGTMWPIVESFVSGGRVGRSLREATGRFNTVWAIAIAAAFWLMAPLMEHGPLLALVGLGGVHLLAIPLLAWFGEEPGRTVAGDHEPHPPAYERLLASMRVLLLLSYVVMSAMAPTLPDMIGRLGVRAAWWTPLASIWLVSRIATFFLLEHWHGWHGRWSAPVIGTAFMLAGFALTITAGDVQAMGLGRLPALAWLAAGLAGFGLGVGTIYAGAFYYAMAVGSAEVEAGGKHEALIGAGYCLGPVCGLIAGKVVEMGWVGSDRFGIAVMVAVGAISALCVLVAWRRGRNIEQDRP